MLASCAIAIQNIDWVRGGTDLRNALFVWVLSGRRCRLPSKNKNKNKIVKKKTLDH